MTEYEVHILYRGQISFEVFAKDEDTAIAAGEDEFLHSPLAHEASEWNTISLTSFPGDKYTAVVSFRGENEYIVDAENEEGARKKALALFQEKSNCASYVTQHDVKSVYVYYGC